MPTLGLMAVAAVGGFWFGRQQVTGGSRAEESDMRAGTREPAAGLNELERVRVENERLTKAAAIASGALAEQRSVRMAQLRALVDAKQAQKFSASALTLPVMGRDGKLSPIFAAMFDLSVAEAVALEGALAEGRQQMDQALAANATITPSEGSVAVVVRPFAEGAEIYDTIMDSFAHTLGPERNPLFVALLTDQFTQAFSSFGAEKRTLSLSREKTLGGEPTVRLMETREGKNNRGSRSFTYPDTTKFAEEYAWLVPLVPAVAELPVSSGPGQPPARR